MLKILPFILFSTLVRYLYRSSVKAVMFLVSEVQKIEDAETGRAKVQ